MFAEEMQLSFHPGTPSSVVASTILKNIDEKVKITRYVVLLFITNAVI